MNSKNKTVLISGASSGIGLETALYFFEQGWNVIATMRNPEKRRTPLHDKGLTDVIHLDVTDSASIQEAVQYALEKYQKIDVLVNNAGYAVCGPFEATTQAQVARQFDTNIYGLMEMARAVLPNFRRQKGGVLINVASIGGQLGFPLYSIYNSTKWAVEGFSEALQYELKPLNIKVKIIEPGVIRTDFYDRSMDMADVTALTEAYVGVLKRSEKRTGEAALRNSTEPRVVACTIYQAATDESWRLRYSVGNDAWLVLFLRWLLPDGMISWLIDKIFLG